MGEVVVDDAIVKGGWGKIAIKRKKHISDILLSGINARVEAEEII